MSKVFFDIGGNGVQYSFEGASENIKEFSTINKDKDYVLKSIAKIIDDNDISEVGISSPCAVNSSTGYLSGLSGIKNYGEFNLYEELKEKTKSIRLKKIIAINDANAALLGAISMEENKPKNAILISIGTGIGGAIYMNDNLIIGQDGYAGEFGYGYSENSNKWNISQTLSSNAFLSNVNKLLKSEKVFSSVKEIFNSRENNLKIMNCIQKWAIDLGNFIMSIGYFMDPELIYISGGISNNDFFISLIQEKINYSAKSLGYPKSFVIKSSNSINSSIKGIQSLLE